MFFDSGHMVFGFVFVFGGSPLGNDIDLSPHFRVGMI